MRKRRLLLALVAVMALFVAACGSDSNSDNGAEAPGTSTTAGETDNSSGDNDNVPEPTQGGKLTVGLEADCNSYAPWLSSCAQSGTNVSNALFDPLVVLSNDGQMVPYLAESVEPNEDATEWTVTLRPGIKFHDGTELTAQVQKEAYEEFLLRSDSILSRGTKNVDEVRVDGDLTYTYVLNNENPQFVYELAGGLGRPFSIEAARANPEDFGSKPVGTGPFKLVSWVRDGSLVAERNSDYWQEGLPYLDEITFVPLPDEDSRQASMQSGDVDAVLYARLGVYLKRYQDLAEQGEVNIYLQPGDVASGILLNTAMPPIDDLRVRRGLTQMLDPEQLIVIVAEAPVASPRQLQVDESSPFFSEKAAEAYPAYDEEAGKALVQEYIDDPNRSDGKAPGSPITFRYMYTNTPSLATQAQYLQSRWGEAGAEVTLIANEMAQSIQNVLKGDFEMVFWRPGLSVSPLSTIRGEYMNPDDLSNYANWTDPRIHEAEAELSTAKSFDDEYAAVEKFLTAVADQVVFIMVASNNEFFATSPDIFGIDSWKTPDGVLGYGARSGATFWGQVYKSK
ncbi:MAG: ABC transporter substrate-binding protein [Acidimicrobiia bacterium]